MILFIGTAILILCAQTAAAGERVKPVEKDAPVGAPVLSLSDYSELLNRNLFSREQRRRRSDPRPEVQMDRPTRNEREREREAEKRREAGASGESDIVLMGIVDKDAVAVAFLEDRRVGKVIAVKTGDSLAGGKVGKITLNAMEFIAGGKTIGVTFGNNLQGGVSSAKPLDSSTVGSSAAGNAVGGAGAPGDPNESIIEKMKRKRQAEGNK